jgi:hypothetical protein
MRKRTHKYYNIDLRSCQAMFWLLKLIHSLSLYCNGIYTCSVLYASNPAGTGLARPVQKIVEAHQMSYGRKENSTRKRLLLTGALGFVRMERGRVCPAVYRPEPRSVRP